MKGRILNIVLVLVLATLPMAANAGWSEAQQVTGQTPPAPAQVEEMPAPDADFNSSPVMFIENVGQWDDGARFQVWGGPAGTMWLADDAIWITVMEAGETSRQVYKGFDPVMPFEDQEEPAPRGGVNIRLSFVGANPQPRIETFDRLDTTVSYFYGNDPEKWRPDVPVWGGVRYVDLYPGIDWEIVSEHGRIVQRLATQSSADLTVIQLRVEGADAVAVDGDQLRVSTDVGDHTMPLVQAAGSSGEPDVQARQGQVFDVFAPFVPQPLVLDQSPQFAPDSPDDNPADLLYSTFLGGATSDTGNALAIDGTGSAYVTGLTRSTDFPTTPGTYDPISNGNDDVFIAKLNPSGSGLVYATFLGGDQNEEGKAITVDGLGNAYLVGSTSSLNFPVTPGAFDPTHQGNADSFLVKINNDGSDLIYSTFLGGGAGRSVVVNGLGQAFVTGTCYDFPVTPGAFDTTGNGMRDVFVAKFNTAGNALEYATYLGGSNNDDGVAITLDGAGYAFVTGATYSSDFPITPNAFDPLYASGNCNSWGGYAPCPDAFVARLSPAGNSLEYSTFLGGGLDDVGYGIAVDGAGRAYVTGRTGSTNFPTTPDAFDPTYNCCSPGFGGSPYVVRLNASGSALDYGTFLGGAGQGSSIAVDGAGSAYVVGTTQIEFPTTPNCFDPVSNGDADVFLARLNPAGTGLIYATYLGGIEREDGNAIALDRSSRAFVTGTTRSSNFPTTPGAFDRSYSGGDAFVAKLAVGSQLPYDAAELASQSEYITVAPGAAISPWIEVRNTGTTTWTTTSYGWNGRGELQGWTGYLTRNVAPGETVRFFWNLDAPTTPGVYDYGFMMHNGTQEFGPYFFVRVTVIPSPDIGFRSNPNGFASANRQLSRTWAMFRQYFGASNVEKPDGTRCAAAQAFFNERYTNVAGGWSCFGFSASSMISYLGWAQPNTGAYAIASYPRLYDQPWSTALEDPIKYYAGTQTSQQPVVEYGEWLASCDQDPSGLVDRIVQSLEARQPMLLSLRAMDGIYHAVTPYNVLEASATTSQVYVYDSEAPGNNTKVINFTRATTNWQWQYTFVGSLASAGTRTGGCKDMYGIRLSTLLEQGEPPVVWCEPPASQSAGDATTGARDPSGYMVINLPPRGDAVIRDDNGRRLGWIGGQLISEIPGAVPILEATAPMLPADRAFYVPVGAYTLETPRQSDGTIHAAAFGDGRAVIMDGVAGSSAVLQVSQDLAETVITNPVAYTSFATTMIEEHPLSSTEAAVSVTQPVGAASLALQSSGNRVVLSRAAGTLTYRLSFRNSGAWDFVSPQIVLGSDEAHFLTYNDVTVMLEIDRGRNGTIDETVTLQNQIQRVYLPLTVRSSATGTSATATATATIAMFTPTSTATSTASATRTPSPTVTSTRTAAPTPTATRTATPSATATRTPSPTATSTRTATPTQPPTSPLPDKFHFAVGAQPSLWYINNPQGVASGPREGEFYVADTGNNRIVHVFDVLTIAQWGTLGTGAGQFNSPLSIAGAPDGTVYVADMGNHRIQHFGPDGAFLAQWGSRGAATGQFESPHGVSVAADGTVYVADTGNHRIQQFSASGAFIRQWGTFGNADGQFAVPRSLVVVPSGQVYVVDSGNSRIQRFTANGSFLGKWGSQGSGNSQFQMPTGITYASDGSLYVTDTGNHRLQHFGATGTYLGQEGTHGNGSNQFSEPWGIAIDPGGWFYVADSLNHRIKIRFCASCNWEQTGVWGRSAGQFDNPRGLGVAPDGSLYVADDNYHRIQHLSAEGAFLGEWGTWGANAGQFSNPSDVAVAPDGTVYVADQNNHRIQRFSSTGTFLGQWGTQGSANGQFNHPFGVAVGPDNTVYVADTWNQRIQRFSTTGVFLSAWGTPGGGNSQFAYPSDVAVGPNGTVYVADTNNHRVQRFTSTGAFLGSWGGLGSGDGQLESPFALAVAADGTVFVADTMHHRIQRFSSTGAFWGKWGTRGIGDGQLDHPVGVAVGLDGRIYVADHENNRIVVFGDSYPDNWRGEFYSNRALTNAPVLVRNDTALNFEWYDNAPGPGVPSNDFSTRFRRSVWFDAGAYRFTVFADDGVRFWIDDNLAIEAWRDPQRDTFTVDRTLSAGYHRLLIEHYDRLGWAALQLSWHRLSSATAE